MAVATGSMIGLGILWYPLFLGLLQAPSPTALPAAFVADG